MALARAFVFPFRRGHAGRVLVAVGPPQNAEIDVAAVDLAQIHVVGAAFLRGNLLEEEHLEELSEDGVLADVGGEVLALLREFALDAGNENPIGHVFRFSLWFGESTIRSRSPSQFFDGRGQAGIDQC